MSIPLRAFIATSLIEILEGVRDAKEKARAAGLSEDLINPDLSSFPGGSSADAGMVRAYDHPGKDRSVPGRYAQFVRFDVAVQVREASEDSVGGQAGFKIGVVSLGASGEMTSANSLQTTSRIEFSVPIRFGE